MREEQKIDHTEPEADEVSFQTKHALGGDILHSFGSVGVDGYDSEAPFENSFPFQLERKELVLDDEIQHRYFEY